MARQKKKQQQQQHSCSGYEADDEGHGSRLISPSLFHITTFISPFDHPCDLPLSSTRMNFHHGLELDIPKVEIAAPRPLKFIQTNKKPQNPSRCVRKINDNPKKIMQQENHEDGDSTAVKNNGARVYDNKRKIYITGKFPRYNRVIKRNKKFIGVHYYRRTERWEAYMWLNQLERQLWFGQHFIPEAAARTSDKAQLVLRKEFEIRLNYAHDDYDMNFIRKCKDLALEDLEKILREQAKDYSEGCTVGLKDTAANLLRHQISEFRKFIEERENNLIEWSTSKYI